MGILGPPLQTFAEKVARREVGIHIGYVDAVLLGDSGEIARLLTVLTTGFIRVELRPPVEAPGVS